MIRNDVRDWDDVRYFLAVYEAGSFTKAAGILKSDQSTVGRRVQALEHRLGAKLFDRHGRGMRPTPAARGLAEYARTMREAVDAIGRRFGGIDGELTGIVRISVTEGLATGWLTPRLAGLQLSHPGILIEIVIGNELADLSTREADIAIRLVRPTDPKLVAQNVGRMRFGFFTVESYIAIFGIPTTIEQLYNHRLIDHTGLVGTTFDPWREIVARHDAVMYRTNSSASYQWAILAGFGIGLFPTYTPKLFPELIRVPIEIDIENEIWLVSHEETNHVARTRVVLDYVRDLFKKDAVEWFS